MSFLPCNFKQALHEHGTYRHMWMVYWEAIILVTQDSKAREQPNFGGNLSLAQDI